MNWRTDQENELEQGLLSGTRRTHQKPRLSESVQSAAKRFALIFLLAASCAIFFYTLAASLPPPIKYITPNLGFRIDGIPLNWAQYSPYSPIEPYRSPPLECIVTQVNILQRHGARYPTSGASANIHAALTKLLSVENYTDPRLDFLKYFYYDLGQNDLVPYGAAQSYDAGQEAWSRYARLVSDADLPFVRASSSERVVLSAVNWTQGFAAASHRRYKPKLSVIISEAGNDTLDDNQCPSAGDSDIQKEIWLSTFAPPIVARLNAAAPGANLTPADVYHLISVCPFETVAKGTGSEFCEMFASMEGAFEGFEYTGDLDKYYGTGYGQELGPVQGVGYINELIARLTNTPVNDTTQTNQTLDSSPTTFPLGRTMYVDFSHDNQMIAIFAAMGLFQQSSPLDPTIPDVFRTWKASQLVPFSSRMVAERLMCWGGQVPEDEKPNMVGRMRGGVEKVRVLVNDQVQPLEFCGADPRDGICTLKRFVESQRFSTENGEGKWERCFEDER